ncbi:sensor histidine kinase [Salinibacterium sp. ZJ450]|uniref:sensor histidine kinase n=1 Tax=Salinibacterium sp. ZJ450 TaxID=2708338 RepID=UPI0014202F94|nr:sensor histidine kinase [Salinibacterium sp. ZJ450]
MTGVTPTRGTAAPPHGARYIRIVRVLSVGLGASGVVFIALAIPSITTQLPVLQPWFGLLALLVTPVLPVALSILSRRLPVGVLKVLAGCIGIGYLVVLVLWMPAMTPPALPSGESPWVLGFLALPTVAAAIAWRPAIAWAYVGVASAALGLLRFFASGGSALVVALQDTLYGAMFSAIMTALAIAMINASARLDVAAAAARAETANAAAAAARERQRARVDGLLHDSVFTALLMTAESAVPPPASASHARQTLAELDRLKAHDAAGVPIDAPDFAALQTETIRQIAPDTALSVQTDATAEVHGDAALALGEALTEALRNSVRHAPLARRSVQITATERGVRILVDDNGPGFDPAAVPSNRLGIAISIIERMRSVAGGDAAVRSTPAGGTRVILQWSRS